MHRIARIAAIIALAAAIATGTANAANLGGTSHYRRVSGPGANRVVFRHNGNTEDSCVTARLVAYSGNRIVYRCATP